MLLYFIYFFLFVDGIFASIVSDKLDINKEEAEANSKQTTTIYHIVMRTVQQARVAAPDKIWEPPDMSSLHYFLH